MLLPEGIQFTRELQRLAASIGFTRKNLAGIFSPITETTIINSKGKVVFVWCGVRRQKQYWGMGYDRQLAYNDLMIRWVTQNSFRAHTESEIATALNVSLEHVNNVTGKVTLKLRKYIRRADLTDLMRSYYKNAN